MAEEATKEDMTTMVPAEQMEGLFVQDLVDKLDEIGCDHLGNVH